MGEEHLHWLIGTTVDIPIVGWEVAVEELPVFLSTIIIALIDGFNPCSLWVLTVLIGLVIHTGNKRVVAVGVTFLTVTAVVYGLFISGVITIMQYVMYLDFIYVGVAVFAFGFATVCIKDFFAFGTWKSLQIPDEYKIKIRRKLRTVVQEDSLLTTMGATAILATGVALVELPCTAGLPVVWSNVVATHDPATEIYALLVLTYVLFYLLIELVIFAVAVTTLSEIRYTKTHGRVLKLFAGMIMLSLGASLLVDPHLLHDPVMTVIIFTATTVITLVIALLDVYTSLLDSVTG